MVMIVAIIVLMLAQTLAGQGLTDYDYQYSRGSGGLVEPTTIDSIHGDSSAQFSVHHTGSSRSMSLTPPEPFALKGLGQFNLGIMPRSGKAEMEIEIYLDGNRDGECSSSRPEDARIIFSAARWDLTGGRGGAGASRLKWMELDVTEMTGRTLSKDRAKVRRGISWTGILDLVGQLDVVKIYLRLKGKDSSCLLDRLLIGEEVLSFETMEREAIKRSRQRTYGAGSTMTYYIVYANNRAEPSDVVVTEDYPAGAGLVEVDPSPDPGTNNRWTFPALPPGQHGRITVRLRMSKGYAEVDEDSRVSGTGLVSVRRSLTTRKESYQVENRATVNGGGINRTASALAWIRSVSGHTLLLQESGSGEYQSEEEMHYLGTSIKASRSFSATSSPVTLNLPHRRIELISPWSSQTQARNDKLKNEFLERHSYCPHLNLTARAELRNSNSLVESRSNLSGLAYSRALSEDERLDFFGMGDLNLSTRAEFCTSSKKAKKPTLDLGCLCHR